jgi:hypothetical protein
MRSGQAGKRAGGRWHVGSAAFLVLAGLLTGARDLPAQETVSTGRAAVKDAAIRVFVVTGSLRVTAWERDSVAVRGRVDAGAGRFVFGGTRNALKLGVEAPAGKEPDGTSDLDVQVPAGARLWIKSTAADVEVTVAGGSLEISSTSGRVRVAGNASETSVETLDGNVELVLHGGIARARTASGTIVVRGVLQDLDASSVSGPLLIGMEGDAGRIRLETVSSEIAFKGGLVPDGRLQAETHAGDIELRLPPALGVSYHMVSYGGGLHNELVPENAVHRGPNKGEYTVKTGDGRATVDVRTFKGAVTIKARGPETY